MMSRKPYLIIYYILNTFTFIFCTFIFAFLLKNKLYRKTYDIDFYNLMTKESAKFEPLIIKLCVISGILSLGFFILLLLYYKKDKSGNSFFDFKIISWLQEIYKRIFDLFLYTYRRIFSAACPQIIPTLLALMKFFLAHQKYYSHIIFLCVVLPRVVIIFIFCIELFNAHLHYYFFSLVLLIIPFIFKCLLFILKDAGPRLLEEYKELIIILDTTETYTEKEKEDLAKQHNISVEQLILRQIKMKPDYDDIDVNEFMRDYYYPLAAIENDIKLYLSPIEVKMKLFTLFFYYSILFFGWAYTYIVYF